MMLSDKSLLGLQMKICFHILEQSLKKILREVCSVCKPACVELKYFTETSVLRLSEEDLESPDGNSRFSKM